MERDRPPVPAEQEALDRPWRIWASIVIAGILAFSLLFGMIVLPAADDRLDTFASICRALGIPGYGNEAAREPALPASPSSQVAWSVATIRQASSGDVERGRALNGENCAACHGEAGVTPDPELYPSQAGQDVDVVWKQLHDYASGARVNEVMTPIAQAMTPQQMADASAFFASLPRQPKIEADTAVPAEIVRLAIEGDPARNLASCNSCHGPSRSGPTGSPALTGQSPQYLEAQLKAFAAGERHNDIYGRMRQVASLLSEDEMRRLAIYYGGRPAR
jgi:cytochrome c553